MKDIKIIDEDIFEKNEKELAKDYWSKINFKGYELEKPWSKFIASKVVEYAPENVLEFGCNAGKNLVAINNLDSNIHTYGIDINCEAIEFAKWLTSISCVCFMG